MIRKSQVYEITEFPGALDGFAFDGKTIFFELKSQRVPGNNYMQSLGSGVALLSPKRNK